MVFDEGQNKWEVQSYSAITDVGIKMGLDFSEDPTEYGIYSTIFKEVV